MNEPVERIVDHTFARWVRSRSGSELLARAAFAALRDEGQGHSCAALSNDEIDVSALRSHTWVGDGNAFTPFVLTDDEKFYVWRNWRHETRLAEAIRARTDARQTPVDVVQLESDVAELFRGTDVAATAAQREAVAAVPGTRLFVLTGGPGTGKTATVLRMVLMLLRHAEACGWQHAPTVALAAPTGKAAQRMAQSIAAGKLDLQRNLVPSSPFLSLLDYVPHAQAQTLHRLLDYRPRENTYGRGIDSPLAADVVVVDETSMVDLAMMRQLFDAVRSDAVIILLGDPAQLYAVEAGSVLGDIVAAGSASHDQQVTLRHVWRAQDDLNRSLDALRDGDAAWCDALIANENAHSMRWRSCVDEASLQAAVAAWVDSHADAFAAVTGDVSDPTAVFRAMRSNQILCALRDGAFGSHGINALVLDVLARRFEVDVTGEWYHGRPVIVTRNDYARDLYNGDVGIALRDGRHMRVWFESRDRDGAPSLRSFSTRTLPAHEPAWAITIHRSQGSEYERVAVVLPPQPDNRVLSRELIYTAMSRATRSVEVWSSSASLRAAIGRPIQRRGGLRERLR